MTAEGDTIREQAEWLLHTWTEPAFGRAPRHDVSIACARNVLTLLDRLAAAEAERDKWQQAYVLRCQLAAEREDALTAERDEARDTIHELRVRIARQADYIAELRGGCYQADCRAERAEAVVAAQSEALRLADELATQFLSFLDNEAPIEEWDGGNIGYSMGGLASIADDYQKARAALDAEGVSEPVTDAPNAPVLPEKQPQVGAGSLTSPVYTAPQAKDYLDAGKWAEDFSAWFRRSLAAPEEPT